MPRTQSRRLTLAELANVAAVSEALFQADTETQWVSFTYTKDTGEVSTRSGFANGVFAQENKTSLYLTPSPEMENGKSYNVRLITNLTVGPPQV